MNLTVHVTGIGNWNVTGGEGFDDACSSALEILEYVFDGATSRFHSPRTWKRGRLGSHRTAQTQLRFTKFRERRENKRNETKRSRRIMVCAAFEYSGVKFISFAWWTMNHLPSILCARFHCNYATTSLLPHNFYFHFFFLFYSVQWFYRVGPTESRNLQPSLLFLSRLIY